MNLLNLAILFALFALVGCIIMLMGNVLGLAMILLGEVAAFVCVWTDERQQRKKFLMRRILG